MEFISVQKSCYLYLKTVIWGLYKQIQNTLAREAMKDKWEQMKEMGARLIEKGSAAKKTATESNSDDAVQHSVLSLCVVNMNEAFSMALRWAAKFVTPERRCSDQR